MRSKKRIISFIMTFAMLISMLTGVMPVTQVSASTLDNGLVLHYEFNDAIGSTTVSDSSGKGNNGTIFGGGTITTDAKGGAIDLSGNQQYVKMPAGVLDGLTDVTVSSWVYMDTAKAWASLYSFSNHPDVGNDAFTGINLAPVNANSKLTFEMTKGGFGGNQLNDTMAPVPIKEWKLITTVISGTDKYAAIYVDGVLKGKVDNLKAKPSDITNQYNYIGYAQFDWEQGPDKGLDGKVSDFRIYDRALNLGEIKTLAGENVTVSVNDINIKTSVGIAPVLPTKVTVNYNDGSTEQLPVVWSGIPTADQYTAGAAIDISGTVATIDGVKNITAHVTVPSTLSIESIAAIKITTNVDTAPELPTVVSAVYNDGSTKDVTVEWPKIDPTKYENIGQFSVEGVVAGTTIKAVANISVISAELPKIWYTFDETAGTTVTNSGSAGEAWNATIKGTTSFSAGIIDGALTLDGSSGHVQLPAGLEFADNTTVSLWTNLNKDNAITMLFVAATASENDNFYISTHGVFGNQAYMAAIDDASKGSNYYLQDSDPIDVGQWVHMAITFEGNMATLYRDGVVIAQKELPAKPSDFNGSNNVNYIGKSCWPADPYIAGTIDDFRIYDKALSSDEISNLYFSQYSDDEVVARAKQALMLEDTVALENIVLPLKGLGGVDISWSSDKPEYIANDGTVTRPSKGTGDQTVTLTATISKNGVTATKEFKIVVLEEGASRYSINIDANENGIQISPDLYGIFFEDINYSTDGGLYAELVQNRSFEFTNNRLKAWTKVQTGGGTGNISVINGESLNENNPYYLELEVMNAGNGVGVSNEGYDTIPIVQGDKYDFSMYVKSDDYTGPIKLSLEGNNGVVYAEQEITGITSEWKKLEAVLEPNKSYDSAKLVVKAIGTGTIDMDMISLFPQRTWKNRNNGMRYDLAKMLYDLHPQFIRFPGGCLVEGNGLDNRYQWKNTVGDVAERKSNWNLWQDPNNFPNYYQSAGLGFYEYFQFAEDIGAEPLPVLNVGMACQVRGGSNVEMVPLSELQPYIDDAIDLIEFANGDPNVNKWAALREEMGHPEPFNLKYLGIGNEQWGSEYFKRYQAFYDQIHDKYPDIQLITSTGTESSGTNYEQAKQWMQQQMVADGAQRPELAQLVDEHYYMNPDWFLENVNRYDNFDRTKMPKVFAGEYAAHTNGNFSQGENNLRAAIAEAAFMTGLEENSDVVQLSTYAPLFGKEDYTQWKPDLIWFNNNTVYGSINYYVQKLFSRNVGDVIVPSELIHRGKGSYAVKGAVGVGSYNTANEFDDVVVTNNADGTVLLSDDFSGDVSKWTVAKGTFAINNGAYAQTSTNTTDALAYAGATDMEDYTLSLKARKTSGSEGIMVYVGVKDSNNYYRWNIGGWSNTKSTFQKVENGVSKQISEVDYVKLPKVTNDTWYNLKIKVSGKKIQAYVDNKLVFDLIDNPKEAPLFATTSKDTETGDIILKVVNSSGAAEDAQIDLNGVSVNSTAIKTVLKGNSLSLQNTFDNPDNVVPVTTKMTGVSNNYTDTFAPYSVTIIRFRTAPGAAPELSSVTIESNKTTASSGDTVRFEITDSKMDDGKDADISMGTVTYESNYPQVISFDHEGKATIADDIGSVTSVDVWVNVDINGKQVKSNTITLSLQKLETDSIEKVKVVSTLGAQPILPEQVEVNYKNGTSGFAAVTWDAISPEQLSTEGEIVVEGQVSGMDTKAIATVKVVQSLEPMNITTTVNKAPVLPSKVVTQYSDGSTLDLDVTWNDVSQDLYSMPGTFTVEGTASLNEYTNPLIEQRADPYIYKHSDGYYYFTASVPAYDRIVLRRAKTIQGLSDAEEVTIWTKHNSGEMSDHIWAPELHYIDGKWYIYFAAGGLNGDIWAIRPYVLEGVGDNPLTAAWTEKGMMQKEASNTISFTNFSLDATTFVNNGTRYFVWAQKTKDPNTPSNIYIAEMINPWTIKGQQVLIATPDYAWERQGYWVNEGAAVIKRNGKIFITFSASATDANYCMGLLTASQDSNLLDPSSWVKTPTPILTSDDESGQYGPGHNTFTVAEDGVTDIMVYHARSYKEISGDPLYDPNRQTRVKRITWNEDGTPNFGDLPADGYSPGAGIKVTATVTVKGEADFTAKTIFNLESLETNKELTANVEINNLKHTEKPILVMMALYNDKNQMVDIQSQSQQVAKATKANYTLSMQLPEDVTGYKVKVFVWEGTDIKASNLKPAWYVTELQ